MSKKGKLIPIRKDCHRCGFQILYERSQREIQTLQQELEEARDAMYEDKLTGVPNRRFFMEVHKSAHAHAIRHEDAYCFAMIDVDHFKTINDRYGHIAGDQVLRALGEQLRAMKRDDDIVARWGGEEFVLIMPETKIGGAEKLLERMMKLVRKMRVRVHDKELSSTVSVGVTEWTVGSTIEQIVHRADTALYVAKAEGRNCIRIG